jgi:hypothetical protein
MRCLPLHWTATLASSSNVRGRALAILWGVLISSVGCAAPHVVPQPTSSATLAASWASRPSMSPAVSSAPPSATVVPNLSPIDGGEPSFHPGPAVTSSIDIERRSFVGPIRATVRASAVWTGTEAIYWGGLYMPPDYKGRGRVSGAGAAYEPAADEWRVLAAAPIAPRQRHFAGWTGAEMLIWGGTGDGGGFVADGAAYDPRSDSWRLLPPPPPAWLADLRAIEEQGGADGAAAIWTAQYWIVGFKGIGDDETDPIRVAAYDPDADSWRELPTVRAGRGGGMGLVWTGTEVVLVSGHDAWRIEIGDEPAWQRVSRAPGGLPLSSPVWLGDRMLAVVSKWGPNATPWSFLATWDPASDTWQQLVQPPQSAHGEVLLDGQRAIVLGSGLAYDLSADAWLGFPLHVDRSDAVLTWTGSELLVWGGWDCEMCPSGVFQDGIVLTPRDKPDTLDTGR